MSINQQRPVIITPSDDPTRAAVENLIASIKSKQLQETQRQSDRKILDIIHRVLGRTVDLVYDEDEQEKNQKELEQQQQQQKPPIEEQPKIPSILEETDSNVTPRAPDVSRMDVETIDEDQEEQDIDEREKPIDSIQTADQDEQIDMSRDPLYRHILLGITDEDLLNVQGTHINKSTSAITKTEAVRVKSAKHDDKTVHHFCIQMLDEKDILPKEVRAITQLYHQRARFRHQLPFSSIYHKHGQLPSFSSKIPIEEEEEEQPQPQPQPQQQQRYVYVYQ
jgi:hypothetical protein